MALLLIGGVLGALGMLGVLAILVTLGGPERHAATTDDYSEE